MEFRRVMALNAVSKKPGCALRAPSMARIESRKEAEGGESGYGKLGCFVVLFSLVRSKKKKMMMMKKEEEEEKNEEGRRRRRRRRQE
jgi:hypothetical protein